MYTAGQLLAEVVEAIVAVVKPGVSTFELDRWIEDQLTKKGLVSECKGYLSYKHVSCISLNDEVVHGVPHEKNSKGWGFGKN